MLAVGYCWYCRTASQVSSTLHLVDLAGSERIKKSKVEGMRRVEAVGINESLMVLSKVITALVEGRRHIPYLGEYHRVAEWCPLRDFYF